MQELSKCRNSLTVRVVKLFYVFTASKPHILMGYLQCGFMGYLQGGILGYLQGGFMGYLQGCFMGNLHCVFIIVSATLLIYHLSEYTTF